MLFYPLKGVTPVGQLRKGIGLSQFLDLLIVIYQLLLHLHRILGEEIGYDEEKYEGCYGIYYRKKIDAALIHRIKCGV